MSRSEARDERNEGDAVNLDITTDVTGSRTAAARILASDGLNDAISSRSVHERQVRRDADHPVKLVMHYTRGFRYTNICPDGQSGLQKIDVPPCSCRQHHQKSKPPCFLPLFLS